MSKLILVKITDAAEKELSDFTLDGGKKNSAEIIKNGFLFAQIIDPRLTEGA